MKKILTGLFSLAMILCCIAPAMAVDQDAEVINTAPEIITINGVSDILAPSPLGNQVNVEVLVEDINGQNDINSCTLVLYYMNGSAKREVFTMEDATPTLSSSDTLQATFEYSFDMPSTWNIGDYIVSCTPYDDSINGATKEKTFNFGPCSVVSCNNVVYAKCSAKEATAGKFKVTNQGNQLQTVNFNFGNLTNTLDSTQIISALGGNVYADPVQVGYEGTPCMNSGALIYCGTGQTPYYEAQGVANILDVGNIISGTYSGTYTISLS